MVGFAVVLVELFGYEFGDGYLFAGFAVVGADLGHRVLGEVAAVGDLPFVVGFNQHRAGQAQQRLRVREDPDNVGAAFACSSIFDVIDVVGSGCSGRHLGGSVEHDPRLVVAVVAVTPAGPRQVLAGQVRSL